MSLITYNGKIVNFGGKYVYRIEQPSVGQWVEYGLFTGMFFADIVSTPSYVLMCGYDNSLETVIVKSTDDGSTWIEKTSPVGIAQFTRMSSPSPSTIYISGTGDGEVPVLLKSNDSGENWVSINTNIDTSYCHFNTVYFIDNSIGWVAGEDQLNPGGNPRVVISHTTDGGNTWQQQGQSLDYGYISAIHFVDASRGWFVGFDITNTLVVGDTSNGGGSWNTQVLSSYTSQYATGITFVDSSHGWLSSYGGDQIILATSDGGQNWIDRSPQNLEPGTLDNIVFSSISNGWGVGVQTNYEVTYLIKTTNGGVDWTIDFSTGNGVSLYALSRDIKFISGQDTLADGHLYKYIQ